MNSFYDQTESIDSLFEYNKQFKILICKTCQYCIIYTNIQSHVKQNHFNAYTKSQLQLLLQQLSTYDIKTSNHVDLPAFNQHNFQNLELFTEGFCCKLCDYAVLNFKSAKKHLNQLHQIKSDDLKSSYLSNQHLQTFFNHSNKQYFLIKKSENTISTSINLLQQYQTQRLQNESTAIISANNIEKDKQLHIFINHANYHHFLNQKNLTELLSIFKYQNQQSEIIKFSSAQVKQCLMISSNIIEDYSRNNLQIIATEKEYDKNNRNLKAFQSLQSDTTKIQYFSLFSELYEYVVAVSTHQNYQHSQPIITSTIHTHLQLVQISLTELFSLKNNQTSKDFLEKQKKFHFQCIALFVALLQQNLTQQSTKNQHTIHNSVVITFLILKSFNKSTKSLIAINDIQRLCSQMIYNFRLVSLQHITNQQNQLEISENQSELSQNQSNQNQTTISQILHQFHTKYLTNASQNCFEEITQIRTLAHKYAETEVNTSKITEISSDLIKYENITISIEEFKAFMHKQIQITSDILCKTLLHTTYSQLLQKINIFELEDIIQERKANFNFIELKSETQDLSNHQNYFIQQLLKNKSSLNQLLIEKMDNTSIIFKEQALYQYFKQRKLFLKHLYILMHITSGSPLRKTELLNITFKNSVEKLYRSVYFDEKSKLIMINTFYHKGQSITQKSKNNIRFLTRDISNLLIFYLLYYNPLYEFLLFHIQSNSTTNSTENLTHHSELSYSAYVFSENNQQLSASTIQDFIQQQTNQYMQNSLQILALRHMLKFIIKRDINKRYDSDSESEDLIEDLQANHSTKTHHAIYARDFTTFSNQSSDIKKKSYQFCLKYFQYFNIENSILTIQKSTLQNQTTQSTLNASQKRRERQRTMSIQMKKRHKSLLNDLNNLNDLNEFNSSTFLTEIDYKSMLIRFWKSNSSDFKSNQQKEAIHLIYHQQSLPLLYIAGTNSGKSLLFTFSAYVKPQCYYLVFLPLIALKQNQQQISQSQDLISEIFEDIENNTANLQFLSYESIETQKFQSYITQLQAQNQQIIIYLDECHLIVTQQSFRYIMLKVKSLLQYTTNIVLMTATMTVTLQKLLFSTLNLSESMNISVLKQSTIRQNISYQVQTLSSSDMFAEFEQILDQICLKLVENEKILIFVDTVQHCEQIAEYFEIPQYHAQLADKSTQLSQFEKNSDEQILVTTKALSEDYHNENIICVLHLYSVRSLTAFIQESGRAGRKNQKSVSILFKTVNQYKQNLK